MVKAGFSASPFTPITSTLGTPGFGKFYVNVTTPARRSSHIREFTVSTGDPNIADSRLP